MGRLADTLCMSAHTKAIRFNAVSIIIQVDSLLANEQQATRPDKRHTASTRANTSIVSHVE
eukprot:363224-Chlamydomonas_euryale.AAC.3